MNLKEFDAKQFLLEKGERVGLGIALTLMVLMLVYSLFMPSHGFFSGSPSAKAEPLEKDSKQLAAALSNPNITPSAEDTPGKTTPEDLIALDTNLLQPRYYEALAWYEPNRTENPARRPPVIQNIDSYIVHVARVLVDTYLFDQKFTSVMVLEDPDNKGGNAGKNPLGGFPGMYGGKNGPNMMGSGSGGKQRTQFNNRGGRAIQGSEEKPDYDTKFVPFTDLNNTSAHLARQPRPARMAIIAASFPYKAQLEEFQRALKLGSIQEVLADTVDDGKGKTDAFRFLGVKVERQELDVNGKVVKPWAALDLADSFKVWMLNSGPPFEVDNPKLEPLKPFFTGLVMPLLREFHEEGPQSAQAEGEAPGGEGRSKYPDLTSQLPKIKATLEALSEAGPKAFAPPPSKFQRNFDVFNPTAPPADGNATPPPDKPASPDATVPEHCLVRLVDITIEPGKFYRYRVKIRMTNPNFNNDNVASPAYKSEKELESKEWLELKQTVTVPPELFYYVVDQKQIAFKDGARKAEKIAPTSPLAKIWRVNPDRERQVVFQFQRWVEATPITPDGEAQPIGDWAVAERVFVARGEYVGQTVKVDLPVWKYTLDSYVLPIEDQKVRKVRGKMPTGVNVNFGTDNSDRETILVDFEGGALVHEPPTPNVEGAPKPAKVTDTSVIEVLMLTPDGKMLARNSATDAKDEKREERRKKAHEHIKEIQEGGKAAKGT